MGDLEYTTATDSEYQIVFRAYHDFIHESSFRGGYLAKQLSGKNSYFKLYCLGGNGNCVRGTLIVDPMLMPDEVSVPKEIFETLKEKGVDYVILNRDPSINTTCIYVCSYVYHTDSPTIKISQFVLRGLHGDQDGDEVNLYYVVKKDRSYYALLTELELKRGTWTNGFRHNVLGNPRYSFSQQQDLMLFEYDDILTQENKFWRSLKRYSRSEKKRIFWDLASFTHRREADEFLRYFLTFCVRHDPGVVPIGNLLRGDGILESVVKSGAKGTGSHIEQYKQLMRGQTIDDILADAITTFNKMVQANHDMKVCGRQHSGSNHIYQNVVLCDKILYCQDMVLVEDIWSCALSSFLLYRPNVVRHAVYEFLDSKQMDQECGVV
jgi:hypothetical protein